jgi:cytosolic carboxypeptidase protein 6
MKTPATQPALLSLLLIVLLLPFARAAETTTVRAGPPATKVTPAPSRAWEFKNDGVTFDSQFATARLSECSRLGPDLYAAVTRPENRPINPSPWFAFRVRSATAKTITVQLTCEGTRLRYQPKISVDATHWVDLPAGAFTPGPNPEEGTLRLEVGPEPLWVAAQEIVSGDALEAWSRTLERLPFVTRAEIGRSLRGKPLYKLDIDATLNGDKAGVIVLISRQHPPETTGSKALMRFVETVAADTPLARSFREKFAVLLVPLVNPDGVEAGHWRHNENGVDTNRDWGIFAQPETRAVRDAILAARKKGRLVLHLDFHSTFSDVVYTQPDDAPSNPPGFTKAWIAGIQQRVPTYELKRSATRTPTPTTSNNWAHREFGIPAITYEVGDNTDRLVLQSVATAAAESMMEQLLASVKSEAAR